MLKMASSAVLERLAARSSQADQIIKDLTDKIMDLRQSAVAEACKKEEESLRRENAALRSEVDALRKQLCQAESRNGRRQIALPSQPAKVNVPTVVMATADNATAEPSNGKTAVEKPKQEKKKKEKKEAKPKAPAEGALPVDISRMNIKVGQIVNVKKHPDADSLYIEEVNLGEERNRTIISGLVNHIPIEKMQDRIALFMCNLKPAKMRGILSEGMIMCASTPEKVEIIDPPAGSKPGDRVIFEGYSGTPDEMLKPKQKVWEQIQPELHINGESAATYKGTPFQVEGIKGLCKAQTMTNCGIK